MGSFSSQDVQLTKSRGFIIFPDGYEEIFLGIYFILIPYITGLLFVFLYVSNVQTEIFKELAKAQDSFIMLWIVGYEIDAIILLLLIFWSFLTSEDDTNKKGKRRQFVRP